MSKIQIYGIGIAFVIYEVPFEMAEKLEEGKLSSDEFYELMEIDPFPLVRREGGITSDLLITVDGNKFKHSFPDIEFADEFDEEEKIEGPDKYYLYKIPLIRTRAPNLAVRWT